jgi:tight adherence protein C
MNRVALGILASATLAAACGLACWIVVPRRLAAVTLAGERGERRRDALERWRAFAVVEPLVRVLAIQVTGLVRPAWLARLEKRLELAGHPFGFDAAELVAAAVITFVAAAVFGALGASAALGAAVPGAIVGGIAGAVAPFMKLDDAIRARLRAVGRGLPAAIDLIALAMQGGGDLLSAMGHVIARLGARDPLRFELQHVVRKLGLGRSRASAFLELAARVPSPVVRQFAASVLQAEKQGTPLAEVLAVQASVMRLKRSEAAEQAAARAAVLIIGPLMLIFACVFVVLLGPFAIKAIRGQLF